MLENKTSFKRLTKKLSSGMPPHPNIKLYLWENMEFHHERKATILFKTGEVINKSYFVSYGYVVIYIIDENLVKHVIMIFGKDEIIARNGFVCKIPSEYYMEVMKDSYLLSISAEHVDIINTFPNSKDFFIATISSFESIELRNLRMKKGTSEEIVLRFYTKYPDLLDRKVIKDDDIASFLNMSTGNLRVMRKKLIKSNKLTPLKFIKR